MTKQKHPLWRDLGSNRAQYTLNELKEFLGEIKEFLPGPDYLSIRPTFLSSGAHFETNHRQTYRPHEIATQLTGGRLGDCTAIFEKLTVISRGSCLLVPAERWQWAREAIPKKETRKNRRVHAFARLYIEDELMQKLEENIVQRIYEAQVYEQFGIPCKRGIILFGPPGTGKTAIAGALKQQLDKAVTFHVIPSNSMQDSRFSVIDLVRKSMEKIRPKGPFGTLLFFEDADVYLKDREAFAANPRIGELLHVLDGAEDFGPLFVIMATNYLNVIDKAILRPGRIDTQIEIGPVDNKETALKMVRAQYPSLKMDYHFFERLISLPTTPAVLMGIVNSAAAKAIQAKRISKDDRLVIENEDFDAKEVKNISRLGFGG